MSDASGEGGGTSEGELSALVYRQLKEIAHARMAGERAGHLLHTTALVHEALLKLTRCGQVRLEDRPLFFRAAAVAMRQILIDHARAARARKRGGTGARRVDLELADLHAAVAFDPDQVLAVDEALERLAARDAAAAELVRLRFFGGLTMEEAADAAGVSLRSAERLWTYARAWLGRELAPGYA
jgi:RNA polymerase sigma factor (TIGR02999 family)